MAPTKKSRAELMREIDAEYYGYLDDEDYLLLKQEELCEKEGYFVMELNITFYVK